MATEREQKLVDIMFEVAQVSRTASVRNLSHEEHMAWVAKQLKGCGFETAPMGLSWGVLVK